MQILIDGDSCNAIHSTESIAMEQAIECHIFCDYTRLIESQYSSIHILDKHKDSADFAIINQCCMGDIVITNDSGLAAMVLAKKAYAINTKGFEYTNHNIMTMLNRRHMRNVATRKTGRKQVKGMISIPEKKKDYAFALKTLIKKATKTYEP